MPIFRTKGSISTVAVFGYVALSSVSAARGETCAPVRNESVVAALSQLFEAASHEDDKLFKEVLAPNFYAFESGKRFDATQFQQLIKAAHSAGKTYVWSVQNTDVHIACNWAWVSYTNRGSVGDASGTQPMSWLESAVLQYQGKRWQIRFLHSTRVASPSTQ